MPAIESLYSLYTCIFLQKNTTVNNNNKNRRNIDSLQILQRKLPTKVHVIQLFGVACHIQEESKFSKKLL